MAAAKEYTVYVDGRADETYKTLRTAVKRARGWAETYPEYDITVKDERGTEAFTLEKVNPGTEG